MSQLITLPFVAHRAKVSSKPTHAHDLPCATVVITSRNRCEELYDAVLSALTQTAVDEVIVLDDGSTDATSEMIADKFPEVRLVRFEKPQGYIALRNLGNEMASNEFVVSIDDDATFSCETVIEESLEMFANPAVGAVAVPFANIQTSPELFQESPDRGREYITETFVGTAHIHRRQTFLRLGGYREIFTHQGEETDFGLRLIESGKFVALAHSHSILHHESPKRSFARMDYYGRRNDCLIVLWNVPLVFLPLQLPLTILGGLAFGVKIGRVGAMFRGMCAGLWTGVRHWFSERRPVSNSAYRKYKRLKRLRSRGGR